MKCVVLKHGLTDNIQSIKAEEALVITKTSSAFIIYYFLILKS